MGLINISNGVPVLMISRKRLDADKEKGSKDPYFFKLVNSAKEKMKSDHSSGFRGHSINHKEKPSRPGFCT